VFRNAAIVSLLTAFALSGCAAPENKDPRFDHVDVPDSFLHARDLENEALKLVADGNRIRHTRRRREHLSRAISLLKDARQLYEDELVENGGNPERQRTIEAEMDRISDHIERVHRERPAE
jgi:hypothetical protein